MACPYPGPPCYTLQGSIKWERRYFNNPVISSIPVKYINILDGNRNLIVSFGPDTVAFAPYYYYELSKSDLEKLDTAISKLPKKELIYEFADSIDKYEFEIKIC